MPRKRSSTHAAARNPRPSRRIHEETPGKLREIAVCPECGATYRNGRWTWKAAPADAYEQVCPACERIASDYPGGVLVVEGEFVAQHREDLIGRIRNLEESEIGEHPLKRIMAIADEGTGFRVTVTDGRLAEALGRGLESAYGGTLEHRGTSSDRENLVRVHWKRD